MFNDTIIDLFHVVHVVYNGWDYFNIYGYYKTIEKTKIFRRHESIRAARGLTNNEHVLSGIPIEREKFFLKRKLRYPEQNLS